MVKGVTSDWPEWHSEVTEKQKEEIQAQTESKYRKTQVLFETKLVAGEGLLENRTDELKAPFGIDINQLSSVKKLWRVTVLAQRFVS